jgi:glucose-6-phosphate isomerase
VTRWDPARQLARDLLGAGIVGRIWQRDVSVWTRDLGGPAARSIANRLGWLDAPALMRQPETLRQIREFDGQVRSDGIRAAYLLGMGGSSLCAEVLRSVFGAAASHADLTVLDTTDEATIAAVSERLDPSRALFLVASKSGGTVEVASLQRYFWQLMEQRSGASAGKHFAAITDPGTPLADAVTGRYRAVFLNPSDIGGRFSALSLFGLVPAALLGVDVSGLLADGQTMAAGCREEGLTNPGLELGAFMGAAALAGRDKLTLLLPPPLSALGLWIEQLVAESTGKQGKGLLPIVDEPLGRPDEYGDDRAFVAIQTEDDAPDDGMQALAAAGHPVFVLRTRATSIGADFFRWEFATAVAGAALGINPFDEPNVKEAKDRTADLLSAFAGSGALPDVPVTAASDGVSVYASRFAGGSPVAVVRAAIDSLQPRDYLAVLSYLTPGAAVHGAIDEFRLAVRRRTRAATTLGVGPRYLHSTGQYHKGGPDRGVCLLITGQDRANTSIPEAPYSFSVLKRAQAIGDFQALEAHGRRVVRVHLEQPGSDEAAVLRQLFRAAVS